MEKIRTYDQYMEVLTSFKRGKARCRTNKMMMRDELAALIDAGKLSYEEIDGTLWFFSDEDYFYSAHLYAPKDAPIQMQAQDKDVLVELMGKEERYDEEMEKELIDAGYGKHDKYLEYGAVLDEIIDDVKKNQRSMRNFLEKHGCYYRLAKKSDYFEMRKLLLDKLGNDYTVLALTDKELKEMENNGRCVLICNSIGDIVAICLYRKCNTVAYEYLLVTAYTGSGLGASAFYEQLVRIYEEGCQRCFVWAREGNTASSDVILRTHKTTGKFYWQFLFKRN